LDIGLLACGSPLGELEQCGVQLEPRPHGKRESEIGRDVDVELVLGLVWLKPDDGIQVRWVGLKNAKAKPYENQSSL